MSMSENRPDARPDSDPPESRPGFFRRLADGARELAYVFGATLAGVFRGGSARPRGEVVQQMFIIGNKSLFFVAVTLAFLGMVFVYQSGIQVRRIIGDTSNLGSEFARLLVYDFGPTLTALMLATRVGAGIAAEIGSMKVTEQIDALRMSGVTPIDYLIVPRFIASVVMTLVLCVVGTVFAFIGGGFTAYSSFDVNPRVFFSADRVNLLHVALGLTKALVYGMAIPVVAGFVGLRARGSSEGVGRATTASVIGCSIAVITLDVIISTAGMIWLASRL